MLILKGVMYCKAERNGRVMTVHKTTKNGWKLIHPSG